jgi:hypothetical protein
MAASSTRLRTKNVASELFRIPYLTPFRSEMRRTKSVESPRNVVLHGSMVIVGLSVSDSLLELDWVVEEVRDMLSDTLALRLAERVSLGVDELDFVRGLVKVFSAVFVTVTPCERVAENVDVAFLFVKVVSFVSVNVNVFVAFAESEGVPAVVS